jgi:hypothetical protein
VPPSADASEATFTIVRREVFEAKKNLESIFVLLAQLAADTLAQTSPRR